jgi:hypothetical protein
MNMKRKLLGLYLNTMHARLSEALQEARSLMPEGAARRTSHKHVVEHEGQKINSAGYVTGSLGLSFGGPCDNQSHYQEVDDGEFLALEPIENFLAEFERDIAKLVGE